MYITNFFYKCTTCTWKHSSLNKVITLTKHVINNMNNNKHCHLYNSATYVVIRHLLNIKLYYVIPAVVHQELKTMDECEKHFLLL